MMRKVLVQALAVVILLCLAGGATAAGSADHRDPRQPAAGDVQRLEPASAVEERMRTAPQRTDGDGDSAGTPTSELSAEESDQESGFGETRAADVAAYHECRAEADNDEAEPCERPGPAWRSDAHPVFGTDGAKAGQTPGERGRERAAAVAPARGHAAGGRHAGR